MTAARCLGFTREAAAKFSFFLATPIIAGAALKHFKDIVAHILNPLFLVGTVVSALVGVFCIGFLLKYLQKNNFASVSMQQYEAMRHEILLEPNHQQVYDDILAWLTHHIN